MKKLLIFFLSLTCVAAQAQYKRRTSVEHDKPITLSYYGAPKSPLVYQPSDIKVTRAVPYEGSALAKNIMYTTYALTPNSPVANYGYWGGTRIQSASANGRFVSIQSYDMQGNFRETKATYQFKKKK